MVEFVSLSKAIDASEQEMVRTLSDIVAIKSISPLSGGEGESKRADFLKSLLEGWGFEVKRYDYTDESNAVRSNLVSKFGNLPRTIWIVAHIDTVSEGDRKLWSTDPFRAVVKEGRIYGRGTNDNGQEGVAAMYAMKLLKESGLQLKYNFGMVFVADEELGSKYGIQKLLQEGIFKKEDMYVVPDWGTEDGNQIEVAEKSILWMKITVTGKQVHASTPKQGKNASRYMARFLTKLDEKLHEKYNATNGIFDPADSTFEMTKHEKNVDSVNIIPGSDVSYVDCRILPQYKVDDVLSFSKQIALEVAGSEVQIAIEEFVREDAAPAVDKNVEIVQLLIKALSDLRKGNPKAVGIGGGTCAAFFRNAGLPAVVWGTEHDVAHQPNEYAVIKDLLEDAKVFAYLFL